MPTIEKTRLPDQVLQSIDDLVQSLGGEFVPQLQLDSSIYLTPSLVLDRRDSGSQITRLMLLESGHIYVHSHAHFSETFTVCRVFGKAYGHLITVKIGKNSKQENIFRSLETLTDGETCTCYPGDIHGINVEGFVLFMVIIQGTYSPQDVSRA